MSAIQFTAPTEINLIACEDITQCAADEAIVRTHRMGICGTDLHIWKWDAWAQKTIPVPMVVGHEFVGEVVAAGSNVNDFHPGEIVSAEAELMDKYLKPQDWLKP